MTDTPREWVDIDTAWIQDYLEEHDLASEFDLDDVLLAAQVSWTLGADEWTRLRDAWEKQRPAGEVGDDAEQERGAEEPLEAAETGLESADAEPAEAKVQAEEVGSIAAQATAEATEELGVGGTDPVEQREEEQRMYELTQGALSDWGAFKELFLNCPDIERVSAWETLADSPIALIERAEELIRIEEEKAEGQKRHADQEFEDDVTRAQNSIVGYYAYCRKHRIAPSLDHLLKFIPMMRTGHSREAVTEAWRREAEYQNWEQR